MSFFTQFPVIRGALLLLCFFALCPASRVRAQVIDVNAKLTKVSSRYCGGKKGCDPGGPDISWTIDGSVSFGNGRTVGMNYQCIHRPDNGHAGDFDISDRTLINTRLNMEGRGYDLCSTPLTFRFEMLAWENDIGSNCAYESGFFNSDDDGWEATYSADISGQDSGVPFTRTVEFSHDQFKFFLEFSYTIQNPVASLETEGVANVACADGTVNLKVNRAAGISGGIFTYQRQLKTGGSWTTFRQTRSDRVSVSSSDLNRYNYRVRAEGTGGCSGYGGNQGWVNAPNRTVTIAPSLAQFLPLNTTASCASSNSGTITYLGESRLAGLRTELALTNQTTGAAVRSVNVAADQNFTFDGLSPGRYRLQASALSFNGNNFSEQISACVSIRSGIIVNESPAASLSSVSPVSPDCGETNGTVSAYLDVPAGRTARLSVMVASSGMPFRTTSFTALDQTIQQQNIPPGTYFLRAETSDGCLTDGATFTIDAPPGAAGGSYTVSSQGADFDVICPNGAVTVRASVPSGQGSYEVTAFNNFSQVDKQTVSAGGTVSFQLAAGSAGLRFKRLGSGCTKFESFTLRENPNLISASVTMQTNPTGCMPMGGSITTEVVNGTAPFTVVVNGDGATEQTFAAPTFTMTNLSAGVNVLTITDANGCEASAFADLMGTSDLLVSALGTLPVTCDGATDGQLSLSAFGGRSPYEWKVDGVQDAFASNNFFPNLPPGVYRITVRDSDGCTAERSLTVEEPDPLQILSVTHDEILCAGNSTTLRVTVRGRPWGNTSFEDEPGLVGEFIDISIDGGVTFTEITTQIFVPQIGADVVIPIPVDPGDYSVVIRSKFNFDCRSNVASYPQANFTEPEPLVAEIIDVQNVSCAGADDGSITVQFSGGTPNYQLVLFTFVTGDPDFVAVSPLVAAEGTYTFSGLPASEPVDEGGFWTGGYAISIADRAVVDGPAIVDDPKDPVATKMLGRPNNPCGLDLPPDWFDDPTIVPIGISEPEQLAITGVINSGPPLSPCDGSGGEITITGVAGGTPPYEYGLSLADMGPSNVLFGFELSFIDQAEDFGVLAYVRDANGCVDTDFVTDFEYAPFTFGLDFRVIDQPGCDPGSLEVTFLNGDGPYALEWFIIGQNEPLGRLETDEESVLLEDLVAGEYVFLPEDSRDCADEVPYTLTGLDPLVITVTGTQGEGCLNAADGSASVAVTGGLPPYDINYLGSVTQGATRTVEDLRQGEHLIAVRDAQGCVATVTANVGVATELVLDLVSTTPFGPCVGAKNGAIELRPGGGTAPYTITFEDDLANPVVVGAGQTVTRTNLGQLDYEARVEDAAGCVQFLAVFPEGPDSLRLDTAALLEPNCVTGAAGTITLEAEGGQGNYVYTMNGGAPQASPEFTGLAAGDYSFTVADKDGCQITEPFTVILNQSGDVTATARAEAPACSGGNGRIVVDVTGAADRYVLSTGLEQTTPVFTNLVAGTYSVEVFSGSCSTTLTGLTITEVEALSIESSFNQNPCTGVGTLTVNASGGTPNYQYAINSLPPDDFNTFAVSPGTTVLVDVQDGNGCFSTFEVAVPDVVPLDAGMPQTTRSECGPGAGSAAVPVSGGTPPYRFQWSDGGPTDSLFQNADGGTYRLTVTDANDCEVVIDNIVVDQTDAVVLDGSTTQTTCGATDGTATVIVPDGVANYSYQWPAGVSATDNEATGLAGGGYTVTVTRTTTGCSNTITLTVMERQAFSFTSETTPTSCGLTNGAITLNVPGDPAGYDFSWSANVSTSGAVATGLAAGDYSFTITLRESGCFSTGELTLAASEAPELSLTEILAEGCGGSTPGQATLRVSGGVAPYEYRWSDGGTGVSRNDLPAGSYSVTVTDGNSCTAMTTLTIASLPAVTLSVRDTEDAGCSATALGRAEVIVGGGAPPFDVRWSNGRQGTAISGLAAGNYTVSVTDDNGCTDELTVTIGTAEGPTVALAERGPADCGVDAGGNASFTISGGTPPFTYLWSNGETTATATNLPSGTQTVTVTDTKGCGTVGTVMIDQREAPAITSIQSVPSECEDGNGRITVSANGGQPPYTISWSHDASLGSFELDGLNAGAYSATITDALGCTVATDPISVGIISGPEAFVRLQAVATCDLDNGVARVVASGGTPPYTFAWENSLSTTDSAGDLPAGTQQVVITDANGCIRTLSFNVSRAAAPSLTTTRVTPALCGVDNGSISLQIGGGTAPLTFAWSHDPTLDGPLAANLPPGDYTLVVTDANGCTDTVTETVAGSPAIDLVSSAIDDGTCGAANGRIALELRGGVPPFRYDWSHDATVTTPAVGGLTAGIYSVVVTDVQGCTFSESFTVGNTDGPEILSTDVVNARCEDGNGTLDVRITGGNPPYVYRWDHDAALTGGQATGLTSGNYRLVVTDANQCPVTANLVVALENAPTVSLSGQQPDCDEAASGSVTSLAQGGSGTLRYAWSNGATSENLTNVPPGNYSLTVTDDNGCTASASTIVPTRRRVAVDPLTAEDFACAAAPGSVSLGVNVAPGELLTELSGGPGEIEVSGAGAGARVDVRSLAEGDYELTLTPTDGCPVVYAFAVTALPVPELALTNNVSVACFGEASGSLTVDLGVAATYRWAASAGNQTTATATGLTAGTYAVTATDNRGCTYSASYTLTEPSSAPVASASVLAQPLCVDSAEGTVVVTASGGTPPYTYDWGTGSGDTLRALTSGTYEVTVTDANGCTTTSGVTLSAPDPLTVGLSATNSGCPEVGTGRITASFSGGQPPYTISWRDDASVTTGNREALTEGTYEVVLTDANGCTETSSVTIGSDSPPTEVTTVNAADPVCENTATGAIEIAPTGNGPFSIAWNTGATGPRIDNLAGGQTYSATITNADGCTVVYEQALSAGATFIPEDLPTESAICANDLYVLDLSGFSGVAVTGPDGITSADTVSLLETEGTYAITVANDIGCTATQDFVLTVTETTFAASIIMASDAVVDRELAVLEASFPAPDRVEWIFDESRVTQTRQENNVYFFRFSEPGDYTIGMEAFFGGCSELVTSDVTMHADSTTIPGIALGGLTIDGFTVAPNPSTGNFTATVALRRPAEVALTLFRDSGERLDRRRLEGQTEVRAAYDLDLNPGTYFLRAQVGAERRLLKIVVQ